MGSKRKRQAQNAVTAAPPPKKHQAAFSKPVSKLPPKEPLDSSPFLDNPRGADLKREVGLYDQLASEVDLERLDAANAIVLGLLGEEAVEESTLQRHLERRLFRGLASGRKGARLGYSVVITEILAQLFGEKDLARTKYTGFTFEKVLGFLVAKTKPDGDLSGQEEKDHFLGLLFGLQCFVRAKILFEDNEMWLTTLEKLFELSKKKPWIREECGWVIVEALAQMNQSQAEITLEKLYNSGLAVSPEGVGIWLMAKKRFPEMKVPSKPWGASGNPLDRLQSLAKALKESSSGDEGSTKIQQAKQTGNWNPQLHFVWDIVLAQFAKALKSKTAGIKYDFENFWKVAVDENLFSSTASRERKFWGFLLFQKVLQDPESYSKLFPSIFSHNLVRCLINHVQDKDRFLNRAADKSLKVLISTVESNPKTLVSVLPRLIGGNGAYNFDKVTKTKTIDRLLTNVNEKNAKYVVEILVGPALNVDSEPAAEAETRRVLLGDYLLTIVRHVNISDAEQDHSWISDIAFPILAKIAYSNDLSSTPPISEKTRTLFRNRLMSVFGHVLSDLSGYTYPCGLLQAFSPDAVGMDEDITTAKDDALSIMGKILKKVKKESDGEKAPLQALALLYSLVIYQLYNGESEAGSILDELKLCYDKLIRHKESEDSDVDASEVLVELLLSFISKPSALLRKVTQHVFSAFMADMTSGGLQLMTDVLESSENLRGQQDMFDQEPEDGEEESEGGDDDDEMDSDVEVIDMNGEEGHLNGHLHKDSDDEEEEEDSEEEDEDDEEAQRLDDALAKALGTNRLDATAAEEASDSDADMTDSEMMALDAKLVEIFSQRKKVPNKKQEQKDAKETMVNFKSRVLDLLEIYVKKQARNPLAFQLLTPLLDLIRTTKTKALGEKAHNIILSFSKAAKKTTGVDAVDTAGQLQLLKNIHVEASKDPSNIYAKAASSASLLVASSLYRADKSNLEGIAKAYMETQVKWVAGDVRMQTVFFDQWVNWCQSHANSKAEGKED